MNIDLSPIDRRKVKNLGEVLEMNNEVLGLMSRYLTVCPDFITKELIEGITGECEITLAEAYTSLLVAACGLDVENNPRDRYLSTAYLRSGIRRLDPQEYRMNPYYRQIRIPEAHFGNWKLTIEKYKPYEAFVCDDIRTDEELKEIPQIGFFDTEFSFPAVMEDGQEWMAIKPNEIETMRQPIAKMSSLCSGSISFLNFLKRRRSISFGKMLLSLRRIACPTAITTMLLWIYGTMYPTDILFTSK